ncbi:unnamed protein product, partial [Rotaria sp. Silwood2]
TMKKLFKLGDLEKQLANIQTSIIELEAWYSHRKTNNKEIEDDIHETCHVFDKYGISYVSIAELKYPMISLNEKIIEEVDELIHIADIDDDERCNCKEYVHILTNKQSENMIDVFLSIIK